MAFFRSETTEAKAKTTASVSMHGGGGIKGEDAYLWPCWAIYLGSSEKEKKLMGSTSALLSLTTWSRGVKLTFGLYGSLSAHVREFYREHVQG